MKKVYPNYTYAKRVARSTAEYEYLKTALQSTTTIDGGLILTTLIELGLIDNGEFSVRSGINGADIEGEDSIYLWAGGTLAQAIEFVKMKKGEPYLDVGNIKFVVTFAGNVYCRDAVLSGRFESNSNGEKVVIDPSDGRKIKLLDADNNEACSLGFYFDGDITQGRLNMQQITLGRISSRLLVTPRELHMEDANWRGFYLSVNPLTGDSRLRLDGLPTSNYGLASGFVWRDGTTLKIVP